MDVAHDEPGPGRGQLLQFGLDEGSQRLPAEVSEAPLRTTSSGSRTETKEARPVARFVA
ncbi:hypothetical protein SALBM311S_06007 [Streptomyces alboniger]